jgi:hypothetical protein
MLVFQSGWNTDAGGKCDVSNSSATASRDAFEDCELALGQCVRCPGLTVRAVLTAVNGG